MAFMNFFKNEDEREDISGEDDKTIGGFNNWKDALESMKSDQVNKHKEMIKVSLEDIIKKLNIYDINSNDLDNIICEKANYFEENREDLKNKYKENDYNKLIYKFSEDILEEYK